MTAWLSRETLEFLVSTSGLQCSFGRCATFSLLDVPLQLWSWIEIAFIHHSLGSILIAPMIFGFARLFLAAQRNIPSLARTVIVRGFCGLLFCFRNQLLRLLNLFGFLRIHEVRDLSSFTCVWQPWTMFDIGHPRCSVLYKSRFSCIWKSEKGSYRRPSGRSTINFASRF
jgi:hypothetical protein